MDVILFGGEDEISLRFTPLLRSLAQENTFGAFFRFTHCAEPFLLCKIRVRNTGISPEFASHPSGWATNSGGDTGTRTLDPLLAKQVL
jgi:hypothetical protein